MPEPIGFAERIGGRWAISLRAWLITSVITIAQALLIAFGEETDSVVRQVAGVIAVVVIGANGIVLLIADRTVLHARREQMMRPSVVLGVYIAAGVASAAVISACFNFASTLPRFADVQVTAETPILTGLPAIPIVASSLLGCALIFDEYNRLRSRENALLARLATLDQDEEIRSDLARTLVESAEREVREATSTVIRDLERAVNALSARERLALTARLDRTLAETVRPLSDRLAAPPEVVRTDRWSTFRATFQRGVIRPGAITIVLTSIIFLFLFNRRGAEYAAIQAGAQIPVTYLPLLLIDRFNRGGRLRPTRVIPMAILAAAVSLVIKAAILQEVLLGEVIVSNLVLGIFWLIAVVILTSVVSASFGARRDDIRVLEEAVDERLVTAARANREVARTSRELAQYVHGTLQSTLLATAFAMERANQANDPAAFAEAAASARAALVETGPVRSEATSLEEAVERQRDLWGAFTEIECTIDVDGEPSPAAIHALDLILEEGISNAKKHGRSAHISVTMDRVGGGIRIRIFDDGPGPGDGNPGYGSTLLDRAAPDAWDLAALDEGGAVLTAVVADG